MKFFKKSRILAAAALSLTLALGACGNGGDDKPAKQSQTPTNTNVEEKVYKIGISQFAEHASLDNCREGFIQGLADAGYVDGENIVIDYQNSAADMNLSTTIAQQFVDKNYDLVCAIATPAATNFYALGSDAGIPLVYCAVSDPVAAQLVPEMGKAGKGVTGVSDIIPVEKQLQLIHSMFPEATKLGILYSTNEPNSETQIALYQEKAPDFGIEIITEGVADATYIPMAAETLAAKVDAITNLTDNLIVENLPIVLEKANAANVPVFGSEEEQVKNGCIASEGLDYIALGKQTGAMAAKVLNGEDISTIGSEYVDPEQSKLTINKAVAESFGATITEEYDARAEYTE